MATSVRIYHIDDTAANIDAGKRGRMLFYDQTKVLLGYYTSANEYRYLLTFDTSYDSTLTTGIGNITVKSAAWYGLGSSGGRWVFTTGEYIDLEDATLRLNGNTLYVDSDKDTYFLLSSDDTIHLEVAGTRTRSISPTWAVWYTRDSNGNTKNSLAYNVGEQTAGTGTYTAASSVAGATTENAIRHVADAGTLTDDGILYIVDEGGTTNMQLAGHGWATMADSSGNKYSCVFRFMDNDCTFTSNDATWVNADTDTKAVLYGIAAVEDGNSTKIYLKNRLGATVDIAYEVWYAQCGESTFE